MCSAGGLFTRYYINTVKVRWIIDIRVHSHIFRISSSEFEVHILIKLLQKHYRTRTKRKQ